MFNLKEKQKKGSSLVNGAMDKGIGLVIVITIIGALAPSMFDTNWSAITGAPTWLGTLMPLIIAVAIFYVVYKFTK